MTGPALADRDDGTLDSAQAAAQQGQDGGTEGHLPAKKQDMRFIGSIELSNVEPDGIADVAVKGNYAYAAAWGAETCEDTGVHVVDLSNVQKPREVGFIPAPAGSYPGEGVDVVRVDTPRFTGDVLLTNNEVCGETGAGGMNLYDVTDPRKPRVLAEGFGDVPRGETTANETHSVFAWDAGKKAYAVMVDNLEATDLDVVDITDPRKPKLIAEYDLAKEFPDILQPGQGLDEVFLHDVVVKQIQGRFVMLASYWDAGYVKLDVTDPRKPVRLADSDFSEPDPLSGEPPEGNAHYADFTLDNRSVIGADEDFGPYAIAARNETDGSALDVSSGSDTPPLEPGETIAGESVYVGRACKEEGDPAVPKGNGRQIAVVERGDCDFTVKVANVEQAGGYAAVLVFNREGEDACNAASAMSVEGGIPAFGVAPREQGFAIFDKSYDDEACLAGDGTRLAGIPLGTKGNRLSFTSYFDGWGYVRLFDPRTMRELDQYSIPEAQDPWYAQRFGDLSVHEVAPSTKDPDLAYLAYYSGGVRVIDVSGRRIEEVGAFIDRGGSDVWGVETFVQRGVEYVVVSDRDKGLYILKYTG